jgi:YbbR domain-containing protein
MKNLGLKIISLLLACVVWFIVSGPRREKLRVRNATATLSIVALPQNLVITTDIPNSVGVRVQGRMSDLRALASQTLEAPADLSKAQAGDIVITIPPTSINVPEGIEVVSVFPNQIRFRIEEVRGREVPIRPLLAGDPPAGYVVGIATAAPDLALVSGPASQIANLSEVTTERIIMTGRTGTFVQNVAVLTDSPLVRVISPLTTQVTVPVLAEVGPSPPVSETTETAGEAKSDEQTGTQ